MNSHLIEAANLQIFDAPHGLPPADYVNLQMAPRGGGYEPTTLRANHAKILAAENVNGLALVMLLRVLNKEDTAQQGFVTIAVDLTGSQLHRTGSDGSALPKSSKTGYREYGAVIENLQHDPDLVTAAIQREQQNAANRAEYLASLLLQEPANDPVEDLESATNEAGEDAPQNAFPFAGHTSRLIHRLETRLH